MIGIEELAELADCRSALNDVLRRLDEVGGGIAAIHVDAAIAQLDRNIEIGSRQAKVGTLDEEVKRAYVTPPTRH